MPATESAGPHLESARHLGPQCAHHAHTGPLQLRKELDGEGCAWDGQRGPSPGQRGGGSGEGEPGGG